MSKSVQAVQEPIVGSAQEPLHDLLKVDVPVYGTVQVPIVGPAQEPTHCPVRADGPVYGSMQEPL